MVALPGGTFTMGSPETEAERRYGEGPQHQVTLEPFAIGKTEVTFAEWDACVAAGSCAGYRPSDNGWGRGKRPVINVSWSDADDYCEWLSRKTGHRYRLPTEAEWEYAARAGTTTRYAFGNVMGKQDANCSLGEKTTQVGVYPPNSWDLYDMHGNVEEVIEDEWHDSYYRAPADGSAWEEAWEYGSSRGHTLHPGNHANPSRSTYIILQKVMRNITTTGVVVAAAGKTIVTAVPPRAGKQGRGAVRLAGVSGGQDA